MVTIGKFVDLRIPAAARSARVTGTCVELGWITVGMVVRHEKGPPR